MEEIKKSPETLVEAIQNKVVQLKTNYKTPTPWNWRKIGDSIAGLSTVVTIVGGVIKNPWICVAAASLGWLGKTLTNFAK